MNNMLVHKIVNSFTERIARPAEGGLLDTISATNVEVLDVVKNLGLTAITILVVVHAVKTKMAIAAILGVIFVAAILFFGLNGGFIWLSGLIGNEIQ